jgi:hypothetical protein
VNGTRYLFATDFRNGKIDTFDASFNRISSAGGFIDADIPEGYVPFGIHAFGNRLVVTYARRSSTSAGEPDAGAGQGFVNEFDGSGRLVRRIASGEQLNAPWGVTVAPNGFGEHSRQLLVANHGDGRINAYDIDTGRYTGTLEDREGQPLAIPGVWSIGFPYAVGVGTGTGTGGTGTGGTGTGGTGTGTGGTGTGGTGGTGSGDTTNGGTGGTGGTGTGGTGTGDSIGSGNGLIQAGFPAATMYFTAGGSGDRIGRDGKFGRITLAANTAGGGTTGGGTTNGGTTDGGATGGDTTGGGTGTGGGTNGGTTNGGTTNGGTTNGGTTGGTTSPDQQDNDGLAGLLDRLNANNANAGGATGTGGTNGTGGTSDTGGTNGTGGTAGTGGTSGTGGTTGMGGTTGAGGTGGTNGSGGANAAGGTTGGAIPASTI